MRRTTICVLIALAATQTPSARQAPAFAGFWSDKEPGGTGGLFSGLSWDGLVSRWKELGAKGGLFERGRYREFLGSVW